MTEPGPVDLTLLSRHDCPLCDEMRIALERWDNGRGRLRLELVDIDADDTLRRRYALRIPVLLLGGREICAGRLDDAALAALDASADA